jgi:hypothetical protein
MSWTPIVVWQSKDNSYRIVDVKGPTPIPASYLTVEYFMAPRYILEARRHDSMGEPVWAKQSTINVNYAINLILE